MNKAILVLYCVTMILWCIFIWSQITKDILEDWKEKKKQKQDRKIFLQNKKQHENELVAKFVNNNRDYLHYSVSDFRKMYEPK